MRHRQVQEILEREGIRLNRRLGQHLLVDPNLVRVVADAAGVRAGDGVLEVGPGAACLTVELARRAARVWAVEIDARMARVAAEVLDRSLGPEERARVEIIEGDILDGSAIAPAVVERIRAARGAVSRLVAAANLPYSVATPFLVALVDSEIAPETAGFMVQREVAERLAASRITKAYGAPSLLVQARMTVEVKTVVGPGAFRPPPAVSSAVIALARRPDALEGPAYARLVVLAEAIFRHRRKTFRNALLLDGRFGDGEALARLFQAAEVSADARVESLAPADLHALARASSAATT